MLVENCWLSSQIMCCRHPHRCLTLRLNKRIIKNLHLQTDGCQCPFFEKSIPLKTLITPLGAKPKLLDQASPKSLQYPHGASLIWVRLKMMLECKVCFTLGCGQGKPCTPGVISSIAEFFASLLIEPVVSGSN